MKTMRTILAVIVIFLFGVWVGSERYNDPAGIIGDGQQQETLNDALDMRKMQEVWDIIHEKFPGDIDQRRLSDGAIRGLVSGLSDPFSAYATKAETKQLEEDLTGAFSGVGIEMTKRRGAVVVIAPLRGSPAENAGVQAQDVIIAVDGEDLIPEEDLADVGARIRGPVGTEVTLTLVREGEDEPLDIAIVRDHIELVSVEWRIDETVGIIEISSFFEDTSPRVREAVREFLTAGVSGIVLDMRNNPGGVLHGAVEVAGHFLPEGSEVVHEIPRDPDKTNIHTAQGPADARDVPIVVVMNGGTASGAEIVAGALRDIRGVTLVGEQTFGKGSVQELVTLRDGSSIRITIAKWFTPAGTKISEEGLEPDIEVSDEDVIERAFAILRGE